MTPNERLTVDDIEQIIDGIEHFCIGVDNDDPELDAIWRPYIVKLEALKVDTSTEPSLRELRVDRTVNGPRASNVFLF